MNSDFNLFKVIIAGTGSLNVTGPGAYTYTINHNLGFTPAFKVFGNYPIASAGTFYSVELTIPIDSTPTVTGYSIYSLMRAYADSSNLYIQINTIGNITNGHWPFKYYIFQETSSV